MHAIRFVDDSALPTGHDFALVVLPDRGAVIFYRRSAVGCREVLEASWAAWRSLTENGCPLRPQAALRAS